jgi:ATP-binding cassette subfamily B protein
MSALDATTVGVVARLWRMAGPMRPVLARGTALRMLQGVLTAAPVGIVVVAIDRLADGRQVSGGQIATWTAIIAACVVVQFVAAWWSARLTWVVGYEEAAQLRLRAVDHLRRVPTGALRQQQTGDVTTALTADMRMIEPVMAEVLPSVVGASIAPVVVLVVTLAVDWRLGLAALVTLVAALPIYLVMERRFVLLARLRQQRQAAAVARMLEYVNGVPVIRAYNQTGQRMARFHQAVDEFRATNLRLVHQLAPLLAAVSTTVELGYAVVVLVAVYLVTGGDVDTATVVMFFVLALRIYQPILAIIGQAELMRIADASLERVTALFETPPQPQPAAPRERDGFAIELDDVRFAYAAGTPDEQPVLDGVSLRIPEGSLTALVGPSGAGKSTIANLVARFWDVQHGAVRIGGVDVREQAPDALIDTLTVVLQDSYLFHDTIADNLRLADPRAGDQRLIEVCTAARCHDFISALPDGYDTVLGEGGATLSGGQRQRLCIARALLKDAPIVILDEPTAAIDPTNERRLQQALSALVAGKTVLVIAHRLATIRRADQILVLDEGRIVEQGRHDQLVAAGGRYAALWQAQQQARGWRVGVPHADLSTRG